MTDRLKISVTVGAYLAKPSRRFPISRWGLALLTGTILVIVLKLLDWAAELLWFRALGYEDVFWRLRFAKLAMFAAAFISVFIYVPLNLLVLARVSDLRTLLRQIMPLVALVSAAVAAIFGFTFYGEWDRILRLVWAQDSGM